MSAQQQASSVDLPLHVRMLSEELVERKSKNDRFSLRAFARKLGLHPSSLSRIMTGKQELSLKAAALILSKLELSPEREQAFIYSVADDKRAKAIELLTGELTRLNKSPVADEADWMPPRLPADVAQPALQH